MKKEREMKEFLVLGFIFLALLVSFSLILLVVLLTLRGQLAFEKEILKETREGIGLSQKEELEREAVFYNEAAEYVLSYENGEPVIRVLERVSAAKPEEIKIYNLSYKSEKSKVALSGYSPNRETLLEFKNNLEKSFSEISFPSSSWVKRNDIEFSVEFIVDKNE